MLFRGFTVSDDVQRVLWEFVLLGCFYDDDEDDNDDDEYEDDEDEDDDEDDDEVDDDEDNDDDEDDDDEDTDDDDDDEKNPLEFSIHILIENMSPKKKKTKVVLCFCEQLSNDWKSSVGDIVYLLFFFCFILFFSYNTSILFWFFFLVGF